MSRVTLILAAMLLAAAPARFAWSSPPADPEEAEIQYSLGKIAANGGDFKKALPLAKSAMDLDTNNIDAIELYIQAAQKLGKVDLILSANQKLGEARKRAEGIKRARDQFQRAVQDMQSERWKLASQRLEFVTHSAVLQPEEDRGFLNEAQFRLGMAYLAQSDLSRAVNILSSSGKSFKQQSHFVLGNFFLQRGYLSEALIHLQVASQGGEDPEVAENARLAVEKLRSFSFYFRGSASVLYDSNPFGLPGDMTYVDGTKNSNLASSLGATCLLRSPVSTRHPWFYNAYVGASQLRSFAQEGKSQLDSEAVSAGLSVTGARYRGGRASLRYDFGYSQSPVAVTPAPVEYTYKPSYHSQAINADFSKTLSERWEAAINAHLAFATFTTPSDIDAFNRTGRTIGGFVYFAMRTSSRWFFPSLKLGYDSNITRGPLSTSRTEYAALSDYIQLGKGTELELSVGYDRKEYYLDPAGRRDGTPRLGLALQIPFSAHVSSLSQLSYSSAHSNVSYYTQNKLVAASGVAFAF